LISVIIKAKVRHKCTCHRLTDQFNKITSHYMKKNMPFLYWIVQNPIYLYRKNRSGPFINDVENLWEEGRRICDNFSIEMTRRSKTIFNILTSFMDDHLLIKLEFVGAIHIIINVVNSVNGHVRKQMSFNQKGNNFFFSQ